MVIKVKTDIFQKYSPKMDDTNIQSDTEIENSSNAMVLSVTEIIRMKRNTVDSKKASKFSLDSDEEEKKARLEVLGLLGLDDQEGQAKADIITGRKAKKLKRKRVKNMNNDNFVKENVKAEEVMREMQDILNMQL